MSVKKITDFPEYGLNPYKQAVAAEEDELLDEAAVNIGEAFVSMIYTLGDTESQLMFYMFSVLDPFTNEVTITREGFMDYLKVDRMLISVLHRCIAEFLERNILSRKAGTLDTYFVNPLVMHDANTRL